jgi:Domain of unknown function (DUF5679)
VRKLLKLGLLAGVAALAARLLRQQPPPEPAPAGQATAAPPPAPPPEPEPPAEAVGESVEGYCMKERKHVQIKDPERTTAKNGREAVRGTCPDCGSTIFRFV